MSGEKVLCCFKNLRATTNGRNILAQNLNLLLKTTTFDIIAKQGANSDMCQLECTRQEADYIRDHLSNLLTRAHRSIWFTYKNTPTDELSKSHRRHIDKPLTALYNFGTMRSYDTFVDYIKNNRHVVSVKVERDACRKPRRLVLQQNYTTCRMVFNLNIFHTDILVKYDQENSNESIQIVFMLKGLPEFQEKLDNGDYMRKCQTTINTNLDMSIISQCSDLWLQFDRRSDAIELLQQLPINNGLGCFVVNYAAFQHVLCSEDPNKFLFGSDCYAIQMLCSLGYLFTDKYHRSQRFRDQFQSYQQQQSPEKFYELCCSLWNTLKENHCYPIENIFSDQETRNCRSARNHCHIPHVIVTPLRVLIQPMHDTNGHRAMRQYTEKKGYQWMLVYIRDEDGLSRVNSMTDNHEIRARYETILKRGICLSPSSSNELTYCYFGSSGSQMKKQEFWFMSILNVTVSDAPRRVNDARMALGDLKKISNVATYIARVGLYLTTSKSTNNSLRRGILSAGNTKYPVELIEDVTRNGYCFTDGVGLISLGLAKQVALSIGIKITNDNDIPSAYQIRLAGCKGMLSIDPRSTPNDNYVKIRPSMMKFDTDDWKLDVVDHSRLMCLSLNNQIIRLLYDLNKENKAVFESLQNRCILQGQWHPPEETYYNVFDSQNIERMKDEQRRQNYLNAKDFLCRNRIPLPVDEARCLFGIADETNSLKDGQCFIQYKKMGLKTYDTVKGKVLVTKNPCLHPGDVRYLEAVDIPALRPFIRDCIVFPVQGSRPHCNEIAGSDLDGDQYWVYWGKEMTIDGSVTPLAYKSTKTKQQFNVTFESIVHHILETIGDPKSGIICNTHSTVADKHSDGTNSSECKLLAEHFSRAIDAAKTGERIEMEEVEKLRQKWCINYPTWMMKENKPSYKSTSINEYLFATAQSLRFDQRAFKNTYKRYDGMNAHTILNLEPDIVDNNDRSQRRLFSSSILLRNTWIKTIRTCISSRRNFLLFLAVLFICISNFSMK
ncbi:unnamed protein product [Adineta ricciae]|uniref:RNA-dependent RNA polymerase n=1 Tax=Adineta ricciae TaxID=249248 RepID=A0A813PZR3_ADIRI|nr:unnamed protein product [Adineta ricciae]